jgi:pimeloyl-ACP methyl ester carboxylesterase
MAMNYSGESLPAVRSVGYDVPMPTVLSADGTSIGFTRTGRGAPLVLVHGISADAERWAPVMQGLEESFTVHAMDRRGRGASGDHESYAIERELEDIAAVVDAIGEPVALVGHSFGGLCTLHAMLRTKRVKQLVVYEPYAPVSPASEPSATTLRYEAMAERGEREEIVTTFLREIIQLGETELRAMRAHPSWAARLAAAHTIPRELGAAEQFRFEPSRFADVTLPITMFLGEKSPDFLKDATARLHAVLPTSHVVVLEGQKHSAMSTAPSLFVRELRAALTSGSRRSYGRPARS